MAYAGLDPSPFEETAGLAFFGAHDKPLQLVLKFKDAYLVRDAIGVVRPSVLANATPNEIFQ